MPVKKVGKMFRWGTKGKLYRSKAKARKQGIAIILSQKRLGKRGKF